MEWPGRCSRRRKYPSSNQPMRARLPGLTKPSHVHAPVFGELNTYIMRLDGDRRGREPDYRMVMPFTTQRTRDCTNGALTVHTSQLPVLGPRARRDHSILGIDVPGYKVERALVRGHRASALNEDSHRASGWTFTMVSTRKRNRTPLTVR